MSVNSIKWLTVQQFFWKDIISCENFFVVQQEIGLLLTSCKLNKYHLFHETDYAICVNFNVVLSKYHNCLMQWFKGIRSASSVTSAQNVKSTVVPIQPRLSILFLDKYELDKQRYNFELSSTKIGNFFGLMKKPVVNSSSLDKWSQVYHLW